MESPPTTSIPLKKRSFTFIQYNHLKGFCQMFSVVSVVEGGTFLRKDCFKLTVYIYFIYLEYKGRFILNIF